LGIVLHAFAYVNTGFHKVNADFHIGRNYTSPLPCMCFSVLFDKFAQSNVKYVVVNCQVYSSALSGYKQSVPALLPSLILTDLAVSDLKMWHRI